MIQTMFYVVVFRRGLDKYSLYLYLGPFGIAMGPEFAGLVQPKPNYSGRQRMEFNVLQVATYAAEAT